jgi:hypothetical protein
MSLSIILRACFIKGPRVLHGKNDYFPCVNWKRTDFKHYVYFRYRFDAYEKYSMLLNKTHYPLSRKFFQILKIGKNEMLD